MGPMMVEVSVDSAQLLAVLGVWSSTPVPGATVTLNPGGTSAVTDLDGTAKFSSLPDDTYTVTCSFPSSGPWAGVHGARMRWVIVETEQDGEATTLGPFDLTSGEIRLILDAQEDPRGRRVVHVEFFIQAAGVTASDST
jgi:hypothetical protein